MKTVKVEDSILRVLDEIRDGEHKKESFPLQAVLKKIPAYRDDIQSSKVEKVERKLKQLRDNEGYEVYIERRFKNTKSGLNEKTTLLQAVAGGGKSSLCVKLMQDWVAGEKIQDITLCFTQG